MSSATRTFRVIDGEVREVASSPSAVRVTAVYCEKQPNKSQALGCHRKQVGMLRREIRRHGISGVRYVPDRHGYKCEMTSARGAEKWMKVYGQMCGVGPLHNAGSEGVD